MSVSTEPRDLVTSDLGEEAAGCYDDAVLLTKRGSEEGAGERGREAAEALEKATEVIVNALKSVPEDKLQSAGYAELLIVYGKALLVHVRREMLTQNVLTADVENEINTASNNGTSKFIDVAEGALDEDVMVVPEKEERGEEEDGEEAKDGISADLNGSKTTDLKAPEAVDDLGAEGEEAGAKSGSKGEEIKESDARKGEPGVVEGKEAAKMAGKTTREEADSEAGLQGGDTQVAGDGAVEPADADSEDDISTAELAWEQLEHARIIIGNLGPGHESRMSAVHEVQGDFLSETDGSDVRAADEYRKAAEAAISADGVASRRVADLYHRRYLSLRKDEPVESIASMQKAIDAFKAFVNTGKGDNEDTETLELMQQDLSVFKESLGSALTTVIGFGNKGGDDLLASSGVHLAGASDEITPVPREIIPVTVKPRRRAVSVAVTNSEPIRVEYASSIADPGHKDEPKEKRRKISADKGEGE
jgi:hypothetical protein